MISVSAEERVMSKEQISVQLLSALNKVQTHFDQKAFLALWVCEGEKIVAPLAQILLAPAKPMNDMDEIDWIRLETVAFTLADIGTLEATQALIDALDLYPNWFDLEEELERFPFRKVQNVQVLRQLSSALNTHQNPSARFVVARLINAMLGHVDGHIPAETITALIQALEDEDFGVRNIVAVNLTYIHQAPTPGLVESLIFALENNDDYVRTYIVKALGNIGDPHAIPSLKIYQQTENKFLREAVQEALRKLGHDPDARE
jgi:hypothetical protein